MTKNTSTTVDPLAGLPVATAKAPRATKPTAAPNGVIDLSAARSERKRRKLTGQAYKDARDFARKATGYDDTSPIWGKRLPAVLTEIEALLDLSESHPDFTSEVDRIERALFLNKELQKRVATGQLIGAQN